MSGKKLTKKEAEEVKRKADLYTPERVKKAMANAGKASAKSEKSE